MNNIILRRGAFYMLPCGCKVTFTPDCPLFVGDDLPDAPTDKIILYVRRGGVLPPANK